MNTTKTTPAASASRHAPEPFAKLLTAAEEMEAEVDMLLRHPAKHNAMRDRESYLKEAAGHIRDAIQSCHEIRQVCADLVDPAAEIAKMRAETAALRVALADIATWLISPDVSQNTLFEIQTIIRAALGGAK